MTVQVPPDESESSHLVLTSYVISTDPKISIIPEFLSPLECSHLMNLAEDAGFAPSLVGRGVYSEGSEILPSQDGFENTLSANRTSLSVLLQPDHDAVVSMIEAKLSALVSLPVDQLEPLVVVKYEPGAFFKAHHDGAFRPITVFIYLNDLDGDRGGETRFPNLNLRVKPRAGTAVVWRNAIENDSEIQADLRLVHEGLPPINCTKYGVNCFFNYKIMR